MVTVSLCMIVRDEEEILERCLNSLADLVEEIIIVDTGSTDSTRKIAERYTQHVYDYTWTGDFAEARNYSFSKATKEYIYCADADEMLDECNRERFRQLKQVLLPEIEIVQMYYCNQLQYNTVYNYDREYRPKLYKRVRRFQWEDPVHEMVRLDPVVYDSEIEILHLPSGEHASRDIRCFVNMWENGKHISKRLHNMYAKELFIAGSDSDFQDADEFFRISAEDTNRSADEVTEACCVLARSARLRGDDTAFIKYALKSVAAGGCAEICYEIGRYFHYKKDYKEASIWYYNAAFETECILYRLCAEVYAKKALAECYEKLGYYERAQEILELLQEETK